MRSQLRQAWIATLPLLWGCGGDDGREDLPDWSAGYEHGEGAEGEAEAEAEAEGEGGTGGTMAIAVDQIDYPARIYELGDINAPCAIVSTGTLDGREEIFCQMEVKEGDLNYSGLMFDLHISAGACEYLWYRFYEYEAWPVGFGPANVSYTIDTEGNIINEDGTEDGKPVCEFDYSRLNSKFPNCCLGTYTLTITDERDGGAVDVRPNRSWEGRTSECFDGAAFAEEDAQFDEDGWPAAKVTYLNWGAFHERFELGSIGDEYGTNVPYANYFDPADHEPDGRPAGLREDGPLYVFPHGYPGGHPFPYYTFDCLDDAREVFGSIRLIVREWNEKEEFFKENNSGDPDTEGSEPGTSYDINDFFDWKDATPGSDAWIYDLD